jgi:hypothetical protein
MQDAVLALVVVLALTVFFGAAGKHQETIKFFTVALGFAVAFLQLRATTHQVENTGRQVEIAVAESRRTVQHEQMDASFRFMDKYNDHQIQRADSIFQRLVNSVRGKPQNQVGVLVDIPENNQALVTIFSFFESMGLAVRSGYADSRALCAYYAKVVENDYEPFDSLVKVRRAKYPDAWIQFEWLYKKWQKDCPNLEPTV